MMTGIGSSIAFATAAVLDLEKRLDQFELPHPISLHVNGCPNSCARPSMIE